MSNNTNKYIAVSYRLYVDSEDGKELLEEATAEKPFHFITGFGIALDAFESKLLAKQKGDDFLHAFQGIDLSLVGCKGRDADPLLEALLGADGCWQQVQVATLFREDTVELADVDRIAQTFENLGVALKGRG